MQEQLDGAQRQQTIVQNCLDYRSQQAQPSSTAQQPQHISSQSAAPQHDEHRAERGDNEHQGYPAYTAVQEASMDPELDIDFEPPGSATGDPNADPFRPDGGSDQPPSGQEAQEAQTASERQQSQADHELYSPGLPAEEPSGSFMADPSLQSEPLTWMSRHGPSRDWLQTDFAALHATWRRWRIANMFISWCVLIK